MDRYTRPDPRRAALLTIDTQNDFTRPGAPAEIPGTMDVVPKLQRLTDAFREAGLPIVHVVRLYQADGSNVDRCRRRTVETGSPIVQPETDGAELIRELKPSSDVALDADQLLSGDFQEIGPQEWFMYKPRWGAFYATGLETFLNDRELNTIVVGGCNFPNCPRTTMYEASEWDLRIVFVTDATSGVYERGLAELDGIGVSLKEIDETVEWLDA